jgi:predicted aminopeptidase
VSNKQHRHNSNTFVFMKRKLRFFSALLFDLLLIPLIIFAIWQTELVVYGLRMGRGQAAIIFHARPVAEVLNDQTVPDSIKTKLCLIEEIRTFAFDELGLNRNENYTSFFDQHGKPLIHVVTACDAFSLHAYEWEYSFLGKMPYKGFFDRKRAEGEKQRLNQRGFDAAIGGASGWSTLGWLNDPILSNMLRRSEGDLAELIIHELTHGTLFVKDDATFNENLASFIGYKGALAFLEHKYGNDSEVLRQYIRGREEDESINQFMLKEARFLDGVYKTIPEEHIRAKKQAVKQAAFDSIIARASHLPQGGDQFSKRLAKRLNEAGNTVFMQFIRYEGKQHEFETELSGFTSIKTYLVYLKEKYPNQ